MLRVTSFMGIHVCYTFSCNILVTCDLGRILVIFTSYLACKYGVNHENWLTCYRVCESKGSSRRMFDDGVGMHEYLLCIILDCGSVC
jgi:hypothetical protein